MMIVNTTNGAIGNMAPLVDYPSIVDIDMGLFNLIKREYLNPNVFDVSFFEKDPKEVRLSLYDRVDENPLTVFSKDKNNKDLNGYYLSFMANKEKEIIELSPFTDVIDMIGLFNSSNDIKTTILCYTKAQFEDAKLIEELDQNDKILYSASADISFPQYFFKHVEDAEIFSAQKGKSFYISKFGPNLSKERNDIKDCKAVVDMSINNNSLNIFDLYRKEG